MRIIEAKRGNFIINENDRYLGRSLIELGEFAEGQVELFEHFVKPGMIVVDAGANIGAHTVAMAKLGATVHAFEPQRSMYYALCGNVALNGLNNVFCYRQGLGGKKETRETIVLDATVENSFGSFSLDYEPIEGSMKDAVEIIPLEIKCHFLKIDVEGWELQVLEGAEPMIRECKPVLYMENDRPDKADGLIQKCYDLGYTPYWHVTHFYRRDNYNKAKANSFGDMCSIDMLALPSGECNLDQAHIGDWPKRFREAA